MRFNYKDTDYELTELCEPNSNETFDIIAIFRVKYCIWQEMELIEVSKEVYERFDDNFEKLEFVNYFYGTDEDIVEIAKQYIDDNVEEKKKKLKECCENYGFNYEFALNQVIPTFMNEGFSEIEAYEECIREIIFQSEE